MAFENVFRGIDFSLPVRAAGAQQAQFMDMLGQAVVAEQKQLDRAQRLKELELAQANKVPDIQKMAQNAVLKRNMGVELSPQETASIQTMAQTQRPQVYTDQMGRTVTMPSPYKSLTGGGPLAQMTGHATPSINPDAPMGAGGGYGGFGTDLPVGQRQNAARASNLAVMMGGAPDIQPVPMNEGDIVNVLEGGKMPFTTSFDMPDKVKYAGGATVPTTFPMPAGVGDTPYGKKQRTEASKKVFEEKSKANIETIAKAQQKVDEKFINDVYVPFTTGGFANVEKQLGELDTVYNRLVKDNVTGNVTDYLPAYLRTLTGARGKKSVDTQELVETVAQRSLRETLGAQFGEKEGDRLISRAYNPRLGESANRMRVNALTKSIKEGAVAKAEAVKYFEQNGTLRGWEGALPTMESIEKSFDSKINNTSTGAPQNNTGWSIRKK